MFSSLLAGCIVSNPLVANHELPGISIQLWSIKDALKEDFNGTLKSLADIGFDGVEFAGHFGSYQDNPKQLNKLLDSLGLSVSGAHVSLDALNESRVKQTLHFYKQLGTTDIIIGWEPKAWHKDGVNEVIQILNKASNEAKKMGMRVGMHSHKRILEKYQESTFWDFIAQSTSKDVILQLDVGWTTYVGEDPIKYINRYPCRTKTTHYKANAILDKQTNKLPLINKDGTDWLNLLKANISVGCTEWLVVEQEEYPNNMSPLQAVSASYQGLSDVINELNKETR